MKALIKIENFISQQTAKKHGLLGCLVESRCDSERMYVSGKEPVYIVKKGRRYYVLED